VFSPTHARFSSSGPTDPDSPEAALGKDKQVYVDLNLLVFALLFFFLTFAVREFRFPSIPIIDRRLVGLEVHFLLFPWESSSVIGLRRVRWEAVSAPCSRVDLGQECFLI